MVQAIKKPSYNCLYGANTTSREKAILILVMWVNSSITTMAQDRRAAFPRIKGTNSKRNAGVCNQWSLKAESVVTLIIQHILRMKISLDGLLCFFPGQSIRKMSHLPRESKKTQDNNNHWQWACCQKLHRNDRAGTPVFLLPKTWVMHAHQSYNAEWMKWKTNAGWIW